MSAGKTFLRAAIDDADAKIARRVREEFFTEDELPFYTAVRDHLDSYGNLPTLDVMRMEGFPLPAIRGSSPATTDYYLDRLRKRFAYTQVNERFPQLTETMKNRDTDGMLQTLREMISNSASALESEQYTTLAEKLGDVRHRYLDAKNNPGLQGIPFGWPSLDAMTGGAQGGDLIVVAGRPSMGKSWLLLKMLHCAWMHGHVAAFTSMEMSLLQIARRFLGLHSGVNPNFIRDGELSTAGENRIMQFIDELQESTPLHLLAGDMSKQVGGVENMIVEFNPDIVFVDSAYLLTPSGKKRGYVSKWESISEVVGQLKALALKYDKPVVISVQFNRNQKSNSSGPMDLGDIAGSDSIPQDASIVLGATKGPSPFQDVQRIIENMKNREGETGRFATAFNFSPVDFREVSLIEHDDESAEDDEYDAAWMS
jgi:replicative DNA helicase